MPGVPNTTDFTLADVIAAVLPSSNDLNECFTDAIAGAFNTTYNPNSTGTNNNLLNFRDYGNDIAAQNLIYMVATFTNPCTATRNIAVWKNNNPNSVQNGNKFWQDSSGSPGSPYPGTEFTIYSALSGLNAATFNLSSTGIASNVTFCSLPSLVLSDVYYFPSGSSTPTTPVDYYYSSTIGNASNLSVGDILYTDAALTTEVSIPVAVKMAYFQTGSTATTTIYGAGECASIVMYENDGVIQVLKEQCPIF
jgi:hypothetical protein